MDVMSDKILGIGVITLVSLSGIMALVFINYVKSILGKIDDVSHVGPLLRKVEELVGKVEKIFITLEVTRETTSIEVNQLKDRVSKLEMIIERLQSERGN
jgi:hypothetical protein